MSSARLWIPDITDFDAAVEQVAAAWSTATSVGNPDRRYVPPWLDASRAAQLQAFVENLLPSLRFQAVEVFVCPPDGGYSRRFQLVAGAYRVAGANGERSVSGLGNPKGALSRFRRRLDAGEPLAHAIRRYRLYTEQTPYHGDLDKAIVGYIDYVIVATLVAHMANMIASDLPGAALATYVADKLDIAIPRLSMENAKLLHEFAREYGFVSGLSMCTHPIPVQVRQAWQKCLDVPKALRARWMAEAAREGEPAANIPTRLFLHLFGADLREYHDWLHSATMRADAEAQYVLLGNVRQGLIEDVERPDKTINPLSLAAYEYAGGDGQEGGRSRGFLMRTEDVPQLLSMMVVPINVAETGAAAGEFRVLLRFLNRYAWRSGRMDFYHYAPNEAGQEPELALALAKTCHPQMERLFEARPHGRGGPQLSVTVSQSRLDLPSSIPSHQRTQQRSSSLVAATPGLHEAFARALILAARTQDQGHRLLLIQGETGTGKDVFAKAIHEQLQRSGDFVEVICGGSHASGDFESELFGLGPGFQDLKGGSESTFELAKNGTVFLNEISDMPWDLQVKLNAPVEYGKFKRRGESKERYMGDVLIIVATQFDLADLVKKGLFRNDLRYRLMRHRVQLPPLRDRGADIYLLAERFLAEAPEAGSVVRIEGTAKDRLRRHQYPGNVRELKEIIEAAANRAHRDRRIQITPEDVDHACGGTQS